jgi:hypothetical protein
MAVNVKLAPYSLGGEVAIAGLTPVTVTYAGRAQNPYPPGNVKVNGVAFPATTSGDAVITWNHRYRLGPFIVAQDAADVPLGPEGNYTIVIVINSVTIRTVTGITGKTYTYTRAQRLIDNANAALPTSITITPVNGSLVGTPRTLTFVMGP